MILHATHFPMHIHFLSFAAKLGDIYTVVPAVLKAL